MSTKTVKLIDCTLRDGGYVNDWKFGHDTICCVFERLVQAGVDIIEVGFLDDRRPFDIDRTIQPDTGCYNRLFEGCDKGSSMVVAMIDYGTCAIENIAPCEESFLDGIRVIFKKPKMKAAVDYARQIKEKGYKVFLQLVSVTAYSDRDMLDLIDLVNELGPYSVSMVDTYGLMHKDQMFHYFHLLDRNLDPNTIIAFHSHNNFQLGYANEVEMIRRSSTHDLAVDGTVYGMGKSAGNAPLELLAMYLNENYGAHYDLDQILEIIDVNIMRIYKEHYWGYSLLFFLSASNRCHPNYINYLLEKHTLSVKAINDIAARIDEDKKLDYNKAHIEELYHAYQEAPAAASRPLEELARELEGRQVLLLGPGHTLASEEERIRDHVRRYRPLVISVNCVPREYDPDYVFIGNSKRYNMLFRAFKQLDERCKVIAVSNISCVDKAFDYVFRYEDLHEEDPLIVDNGFIMALKALARSGVRGVTLAGFDGFSEDSLNYYDEYLDFTADYEQLVQVTVKIREALARLKDEIAVEFLTRSKYED